MKQIALIAALCLSAAAPLLADGTNVLADTESRYSYAIGVAVGRNLAQTLKMQDMEVNPDLVTRAIKDVLCSNATLLTPDEIQQTLTNLQAYIRVKAQAKQAELEVKNRAEAVAFLATNKSNPGVVTLPDGLQYKVITQGDGEIPDDNSTVLVNFRGALVDGTEFDNTARTGKPMQLTVGQVFRGWSEALKLMKTGSKWQLFVPPELAFGQNGMSSRIPPNAALIMDVELLSIQHPNVQPADVPAAPPNPPLTSDIIKVPSADEMKKGAKIEIIKPEDVQKLQQAHP